MTINNVLMLSKLLENKKNDIVNVTTAYKFSKILSFFSSDLNFFKEKYNELINLYKEDNSNNEEIKIKPEHINIFNNKVNELLEIKVEDCPTKIKIEELNNFKLTLEESNILFPFIIE